MSAPDYLVEHWTTALAEADYENKPPLVVTVNDRAATRRAIVSRLHEREISFVDRAGWQAHAAVQKDMQADWSYSKIAIHHAGRSSSCGHGTEQMHAIQDLHLHHSPMKWPDIGYHYAVDCAGNVLEGRDIRFKGGHLKDFNTAAIGIVLLQDLSDTQDSADSISRLKGLQKAMGWRTKADITESQISSLKILIDVLRLFFKISELGGHVEFKGQSTDEGKLCPGARGLALVAELRAWSGLLKPES